MLKETEIEETRLLCFIFVIGGILMGWGTQAPCPLPHLGYAYECNFNAICDIKILCAFLLVCLCVHVKTALMVPFWMIMRNK